MSAQRCTGPPVGCMHNQCRYTQRGRRAPLGMEMFDLKRSMCTLHWEAQHFSLFILLIRKIPVLPGNVCCLEAVIQYRQTTRSCIDINLQVGGSGGFISEDSWTPWIFLAFSESIFWIWIAGYYQKTEAKYYAPNSVCWLVLVNMHMLSSQYFRHFVWMFSKL